MKLSIIVVNYNVKYFLEHALLSVSKAIENIEAEVIVVDNNSSDGSVEMLQTKFPGINLIANKDNPGFSKANNQAIRIAEGEYVLLLNPDTVVEEDTFSQCISFMDETPDCGALGVRMIDGTGKFLPESKRGFPSPWVAFCKTFGLSKLFPKSTLFNKYHLGYLSEDEVHEIDILAGAFMFIRKSVLDKIGLLDESFFMYGEDIDLSYRIQQAGYKNYYFPDTTIIHYKGESTRKGSLNYVKVFYNAMIIFAKKHVKGASGKFYIFLLQFAIYFRAFITLCNNFIKSAWLPVLDAILIVSGMILLKNFWAVNYFRIPEYFEHPKFYAFNLPLYLCLWLGSIYLSGGYQEKYQVKNTIRGILAGTLVLAAVYGFLPQDYRFSRALIILGAVWSVLSTVGLRIILHFIKYRNFDIGIEQQKTMVIVGSEKESERTRQLLQKAAVKNNFIGTVCPDSNCPGHAFLGHIADLDDIIHVYHVNEVIFCSADVSSQAIMHWMAKLGSTVEFKILPKESLSIIGSNSKDTPGELYTIDIAYAIDDPINRRHKRFMDFLLSISFLLVSPILILVQKKKFNFLLNVFKVAFGKKSWVGYVDIPDGAIDLPIIKNGVLNPAISLRVKSLDESTLKRLNYLYAKDYSTSRDLNIIISSISDLGAS